LQGKLFEVQNNKIVAQRLAPVLATLDVCRLVEAQPRDVSDATPGWTRG